MDSMIRSGTFLPAGPAGPHTTRLSQGPCLTFGFICGSQPFGLDCQQTLPLRLFVRSQIDPSSDLLVVASTYLLHKQYQTKLKPLKICHPPPPHGCHTSSKLLIFFLYWLICRAQKVTISGGDTRFHIFFPFSIDLNPSMIWEEVWQHETTLSIIP